MFEKIYYYILFLNIQVFMSSLYNYLKGTMLFVVCLMLGLEVVANLELCSKNPF